MVCLKSGLQKIRTFAFLRKNSCPKIRTFTKNRCTYESGFYANHCISRNNEKFNAFHEVSRRNRNRLPKCLRWAYLEGYTSGCFFTWLNESWFIQWITITTQVIKLMTSSFDQGYIDHSFYLFITVCHFVTNIWSHKNHSKPLIE